MATSCTCHGIHSIRQPADQHNNSASQPMWLPTGCSHAPELHTDRSALSQSAGRERQNFPTPHKPMSEAHAQLSWWAAHFGHTQTRQTATVTQAA
mmetsp:Transcript_33713/g.97246  ORF Transcript_33713/g.97246 Transcript_33713/m.97246 type:complete len:95 (-) Transcript_33713:17-301(-)